MSLSLRPPWPDDGVSDEALSRALAGARPASEGHHDELRGVRATPDPVPPGVAPLWRRFLRAQGPQGWQELGATLARIRHRVQDDGATYNVRSEEHTSELQSHHDLVCRLLLEKK